MPLRDDRFVGITDLVTRRAQPTLRALVTAGFELAHSYLPTPRQRTLLSRHFIRQSVF